MTAEEFERHVLGSDRGCYRDRGKARLARLRRGYAAYLKAHHEKSLRKLIDLARVAGSGEMDFIWKAAAERDAGTPAAVVPELMQEHQ
jgi:hypothetical protein